MIAEIISPLYDRWKVDAKLNSNETIVFYLKEFKGYKMFEIAQEINYSEVQVKRIYKAARKKINKILP